MYDKSLIPYLAVILLIVVSIGVTISDEARGAGTPAITITISDNNQTVVITDEEYSIVTFTGTVSAQIPAMPPGQVLGVQLNINQDGYMATFDPTEMIFTESGQDIPFTMELSVGKLVPAGYNEVYINARWYYSPGVIQGNTPGAGMAIVEVTEYVDGDLNVPSTFTISDGETSHIEFRAYNTGNVDTVYNLEYDGLEKAERFNIEIIKAPETVESEHLYWGFTSVGMSASDIPEGEEFTIEIILKSGDMEILDTASVLVMLVEAEDLYPPDDDDDTGDDDPSDDEDPGDDDTPNDDTSDDTVPSGDDDTTEEPASSGSESSGLLDSGSLPIIIGIVAGIAIIIGLVIYFVVRITKKG